MVKTYSLNKKGARDFGKQPLCEFCQKEATYWSQNEDGKKPLGSVIYHCQLHRDEARQEVNNGVSYGSIHNDCFLQELNDLIILFPYSECENI